ncbi:MAG: YlxR family protein [Thermodesulforhabdaceae bacterium]
MLETGKKNHVPIRTCIVCGSKRPKKELLRLALNPNGSVVLDPSQKMSGRGAYVCPECISQLKWNKRLERAFRGQARKLEISQTQFASVYPSLRGHEMVVVNLMKTEQQEIA